MSIRSSKLWSALAVLAAILLSVAGLASPAAALTARTLSVSVTPAYQYAGLPVTFSGAVTKSPTGSVIKIQRKSGTSWVAAGQTTTKNAAGAYSVKVNAPSTPAAYTYRALAPGTRTLAAASSSRTVRVTVVRSTTATLTINPTSIVTGASADFTGSVTPFVTGGSVTIQRLSGASWVNVDSTFLSASGTYTLPVTPAAEGTFSYRASVPMNGLNAAAVSATKTLTVTNPNAPVIVTTALPDGDQGLPYSTTLIKTGDNGTWSVPAGSLPGGLTLNGATGVLSGTPTGSGTRNLSVTFTTGAGLATNKILPLTINPGPAITTATLPNATQGVAYSTALAKTGRPGTWSIQGLPAGLSINADTGVISGRTNAAAGDYGVYPTYTETVGGRSALKALALHINAGQVTPPSGPTITTTTLPDGDQGLPYSVTLTHTGGAGTWAIAPGPALKPGLTLNPSSGTISGTPTGNSTSTFTVTFTETGSGLTASKALTMYISPLPTITTTTLPDATRGAAYSAPLAKTGKAGTWSIQNLPAGLTINADTGAISGTTNIAVGDYGVYPTFTETSTGRSVLKALALHVGGVPLAITTDPALPDGHKNAAYSVTFTKTGGDGTWSALQLPDGFTLNPTTGTLTGTPQVAGLYAIYLTFTETVGGGSVFKSFSLKIVQPKITTTALADGVTGTAYSQQLTKTGLDGTWEVIGFLPDAITLSAAGLLAGTPTETGDFQLQIKFTETSTGVSSQQLYILHVADPGSPTITTTSLPNGTVGTPYSATLAATPTGGTWSITQGSLPVGVSLNAATGAITGTPAVAEDARFVVTYTKGATKNTKYLRLLVP